MEPNTTKSTSERSDTTLVWSKDHVLLDRLLNHQDLVRDLRHFGHNGLASLEGVFSHDGNAAILIEHLGNPVGFFLFIGHEVHTCILSTFRGAKAVQAARGAVSYFFMTTKFDKITSYSYSKNVTLFAKLAGLSVVGEDDNGFGRFVKLEITRDEWLKKMTTP